MIINRVGIAVFALMIMLAGLSGCGGSWAYNPSAPTSNPIPFISALTPTDPWNAQTGTITESQIGELTISLDSVCYQAFICPTAGGYYYVFGSLGALDVQRMVL